MSISFPIAVYAVFIAYKNIRWKHIGSQWHSRQQNTMGWGTILWAIGISCKELVRKWIKRLNWFHSPWHCDVTIRAFFKPQIAQVWHYLQAGSHPGVVISTCLGWPDSWESPRALEKVSSCRFSKAIVSRSSGTFWVWHTLKQKYLRSTYADDILLWSLVHFYSKTASLLFLCQSITQKTSHTQIK